MDRFRELKRYPKIVMLLMAVMVIVFTVVYPITISKEGFEYQDAIFTPEQAEDSTVYSGRLLGDEASFTVYGDTTVEFRHGDKLYGPYILTEDPSAVPDMGLLGEPKGVELRQGDQVVFRGCMLGNGRDLSLFNQDGTPVSPTVFMVLNDGTAMDINGNVIDTSEPSAYTIIQLMTGPELTHKGQWVFFFLGLLTCLVNVCLILFADELFRFRMSFIIRDADQAEPSNWEMAGRYIGWTLLSLVALYSFIVGLK